MSSLNLSVGAAGIGRDRPPHLDPSTTSRNDYSPAASSSSTPRHRSPLPPSHFPQLHSDSIIPDPDPEGEGEDEENIFRDMSFEEIMEDLNARFLINLPKEEMSLVRVYWQAEQAHWFYEDYLRPLNPSLPSLSQRNFTRDIIESSPLYAGLLSAGGIDYDKVWEEYCGYKRMVPCCGGILLNRDGDKCLVVRGYKSNAGWSFPRGKINLDESEDACAIREVEEETGFDLTGMINPKDNITTHINAQKVTMFIILGIDEGTVFETQTRNEIGAIEWVKLTDLPTWSTKRGPKRTGGQGQKKFYNVTPFVNPLKNWLREHGIDPYARPKKKSHPPNSYRDLQPYQFESPPLQPASPIVSRGSSALDHLFARFIHKQEEELEVPEGEAVVGSDNKAGLERLFGNLNVLKSEEQSILSAPNRDQKSPEDREREKKEDVALARLLGAIGGLQTPAPDPPILATTQKQSNLLAMLNQRSPQSHLPTRADQQQQRSQEQAQGSPTKPHQAKLLAMISPPMAGGNVASPAATATATAIQTPNKPMSLPTSPRPPSPATHDAGEAERKAKARALLDMTLAGIGVDVPANHVNQLDSFAHSQGAAIGQMGGRPVPSGQRITPPRSGMSVNQLPPTQPIPSSSYGHHNHPQPYRPVSQPPQHTYGQQPLPQLRSNGQPGGLPSGPGSVPARQYSGSPTKSGLPPPPYEAQAFGFSGVNGNLDPRIGQVPLPGQPQPGQIQRPPVGPGLPNIPSQPAYRPVSQPSHGQSYGLPPLPPPGVGYHGHPNPPATQFPPNNGPGFALPLPQQQVFQSLPPQGYQPQPQQQQHRVGPIPPGPQAFSHQPLGQCPPFQQSLQQSQLQPQPQLQQQHQQVLLHQLQQGIMPQHQAQLAQAQTPRSSPKSQPVQGQGQVVHHPVPRPPVGSGGPANLLAMLNGSGSGMGVQAQERGQGR